MEKIVKYSNDKITVNWEPNKCIHSAICLKGLNSVFDVRRKKWIDVDAASPEEIIAQVKKCPSGAISV